MEASFDSYYEKEDFIAEAFYHKKKSTAALQYIIMAILSIGIIPFICWKSPYYMAKYFYERCEKEEANFLLIRSLDNTFDIVKLEVTEDPFNNDMGAIFTYRKLTYYYDTVANTFRYVALPFKKYKLEDLRNIYASDHGFNNLKKLEDITGGNNLHIEEITFLQFLVQESINPFFVIQLIGVIIWFIQLYYIFAIAVLVANVVFTSLNYLITVTKLKKLKKLAECATTVRVKREGEWKGISSIALMPGDIIDLPVGGPIPCDCLLLSGEMLVDESMLTGESVPQAKNAYVKEGELTVDKNSGNFLYAGTTLLQKSESHSIVLRTGFATEKGSIIRGLLFPYSYGLDFYRSGLKLVGIMLFLGIAFYIPLMVNYVEWDREDLFLAGITFHCLLWCFPPAVPLYHAAAKVWAMLRLSSKNIYCNNPDKLLQAGNVSLCLFDKTGTLTDSFLNFKGVVLSEDSMYITYPDSLKDSGKKSSSMLKAIVSCNSLNLYNGELVGDPLEIEMFKSSGWEYQSANKIEIITFTDGKKIISREKLFPFDSQKQMMSVIIQDEESDTILITKGAPDSMLSIFDPSSVPQLYKEVQENLAKEGFRILAVGAKSQDSSFEHKSREELESELEFLGFLLFENNLRPESSTTIDNLKNAGINVAIISGDIPSTTISIGYKSKVIDANKSLYLIDSEENELFAVKQEMFSYNTQNEQYLLTTERENLLSHRQGASGKSLLPLTMTQMKTDLDWSSGCDLAITGKALEYIFEDEESISPELFSKIKVYAKTLPSQKAEVVSLAQDLGEIVCMCGDGTNDTSAIQEADVGVSFSNCQASLASPFTSTVFEIRAVEKIIGEGKATMQSCIEIFKSTIIFNSLKFISAFLFSFSGTFFASIHLTWITFVNGVVLFIFNGASTPINSLKSIKPDKNLISVRNLISVFGTIALYGIALIIIYTRIAKIYDMPYYMDVLDEGFDVTALVLMLSLMGDLIVFGLYYGPSLKSQIFKNIVFYIFILLFVLNSFQVFDNNSRFRVLRLFDLDLEEKRDLYIVTLAFFVGVFILEKLLNIFFDKENRVHNDSSPKNKE